MRNPGHRFTRTAAVAAAAVALAAPATAFAGGVSPMQQQAPPAARASGGGSFAHGLGREVVAGLFGVAAAAVGALLARRRSASTG
jgi:hypothetical protein